MLVYVSANLKITFVILRLLYDWSVRTFYVPCEPLAGIAFELCTLELYLGFGVVNT